MMVSPIEASELIDYLRENHLFTQEMKERLEQTVLKYRLNHSVGNGRKSFLRRTYTCPFFNHGELGCPLPKEVKPYGCLAFNPHHIHHKAGEHCFSEKSLLEKREAMAKDEIQLNQELKRKFGLSWDKAPLPLALLDFFNH